MLKKFSDKLRAFFFPPAGTKVWIRILPYLTLGVLTLFVLVGSAYAWDYTNSPEFCGTFCHTMPPEYTAYLTSPHARIDCVECHIGRGFIATRVTRKAGDVKHIISLIFKDYEYPIQADDLRPARETCELCHFPEKFSDDSLREISRFNPDRSNTPISIYLTLKTGGGSKRVGLGRGIHWHIENQILYLPTDEREQIIPYIQVLEEDGTSTEYIELGSGIDPEAVNPEELKEMDCITCHNRITHLIATPENTVDQLMSLGVISPSIPEIRLKAVEVYGTGYDSLQLGINGIAGLDGYYRVVYPEFYEQNEQLIQDAIYALQEAYQNSVYPEQNTDWSSHPNNIGHKDSPGCFRCHDGKHLNQDQEAIRLECNLCHSIPVVAGPSDFVTEIEISRGPEPASHLNPNWITIHHEVINPSCSNCHSTANPGGVDNSSFCSNSACHGTTWEFAGFDAPGLREILRQQIPEEPIPTAPEDAPLTYEARIGPLLVERCGACHSEDGLQGLNLTTYEGIIRGGQNGSSIIPGDPEDSLLVKKQSSPQSHFGQLNLEELGWVIQWIRAGAPDP